MAGFLYQRPTCLHATNAQWTFAVRYNGDIYAVNRSGTSGMTELHVLSAASDYQHFITHVATGLHATNADWEFSVNFDGDLFGFCRSGTSGRVEVHVLSAASNYQQFKVHSPTSLHPVNKSGELWDLLLGPEDDLYAIKRQGSSGKTELHVMRASNSYSTFAIQTATGQGVTGSDCSFAVSSNRDLCIALHHGATDMTEIHVLTAESNYQQFGLHTATGLHPIDDSWSFLAPQPFAPGFIKRQGASGMTEVHVPVLNMPQSAIQSNYMNLFAPLTNDEIGECKVQAAIWGAAGSVSGIRGVVAGAVAGCLSALHVRERILEFFRERERAEFESLDRINHDLERWERERNTA